MKKLLNCLLFMGLMHNLAAMPTFTAVWTLNQGLAQPESVIYDAKRSRLYVSNVQGHPTEKDGKGFIAILSLEGQLLQKEWITEGLQAPKGMAIVGDTLYVADIDSLVAIHLPTQKVVKRYQVPEAKFLNDVTADLQGQVYVSDTLTDTLYRLDGANLKEWLHHPQLMSPNGLLAETDRLVLGSWGIRSQGLTTSTGGYLQTIRYRDKKITSLGEAKPLGNLDGVASDGQGGYYVSDFMAGKLFYFKAAGQAQELMQLKTGTADITYLIDQSLLIVPMMEDNQVRAFKLTSR